MVSATMDRSMLARLAHVLSSSRSPLVLTGAGCSTESGIADYRDVEGNWKHRAPVTIATFLRSSEARTRYWARSYLGWPRFRLAAPNRAHRALGALEERDLVSGIITQNVDGLHQKAGSRNVIDLHGRLDTVVCLGCGLRRDRDEVQTELRAHNPNFSARVEYEAPDGDAELEAVDYSSFDVPDCAGCGGLLKPEVVFFGESVPARRVEQAFAALSAADALLVVGSSLMVFSGYRFVRRALERKIPVCLINLGRTRVDDAATVKVSASCGDVLSELVLELLSVPSTPPSASSMR